MDLSALESSVKALETSLDSAEVWITVSTVLVVIGLVIEYWFPLRALIAEIQKRPPFPWKLLMEIIGGVLVTVGVAGELWFQSRASNLQNFIRSDSHQIEALLNKEASDARRDAGNANKEAGVARGEAGSANERAEELGKKAATLRKQAEDERLARVKIEERLAPRVLTGSQIAKITRVARRFPGQRLKVSRYELSTEALDLSRQLEAALSAGGWSVEIIAFVSGAENSSGVLFLSDNDQTVPAITAIRTAISDMGLLGNSLMKIDRNGHTERVLITRYTFLPIPLEQNAILLFVGPKP